MGEEIAFENGGISDFQGLMTLTLTLDRVILHTVMHHSSTSTYVPNFIEIEEIFCGRTDVRTRPTLLGRLRGVDLITQKDHSKFIILSYPRHQWWVGNDRNGMTAVEILLHQQILAYDNKSHKEQFILSL